MWRITLSLIFLFIINVFSQVTDSTKIKIPDSDSTAVFADTLQNKIVDTTSTSDTTALLSTKENVVKVDTLIPLYQKPLNNNSYIITREEILKNNYRFTSDLLKQFPLNFIRDYGFLGYPDENIIYSAGNGSISYLEDGVLWNNRFTNSVDLNLIQSESIDSIEVIPSPRGFLYSPYNNPVSINYLQKDLISITPYSRIKYYEGPSGEAFIDLLFNTVVIKDFVLSLDITNRKVDESYTNTDLSLWQGKVKLKYLLSKSVNLIGYYNYDKFEQGLNGGVDINELAGNNVTSSIYDEGAPVNFPYRRSTIKRHNPGIKMVGKFVKNSNTDLNVYYNFTENNLAVLNDFNNYKIKTAGVHFKHKQSLKFIELNLLGNYEKSEYKFKQIYTGTNEDYYLGNHAYALAGVLSMYLADSSIIPSFFYKINKRSYFNSTLHGIGGDLTIKFSDKFRLYGGYSMVENNTGGNNYKNFEASAFIKLTNFNLKFLLAKRVGFIPYNLDYPFTPNIEQPVTNTRSIYNYWNVGSRIKINYWDLLLDISALYYFKSNGELLNLPDIDLQSGIYYKNILFERNLDLKTGFLFYFTGSQKYNNAITVGSSYKIDFTLIGEIQDVAIVYFTWENLTDNNYFITPFYPMPGIGIRFGLAWELLN